MTNNIPTLPANDRIKRLNQEDDEYEYEEVNEERGCSGCAWGLVGFVGCMGIPIGLLIFALITGGGILGGVFDGIGQIFNPRPPVYTTITTPAVLESVRQLSELSTVEYNFSQLIISERELPPVLQSLYFDKLIYYAVGRTQAGINLNALNEEDVIITGTTLTLVLPPPQLLDCFIDEGASRVVSRDTGTFANPAPNIEREARQTALVYFRGLAVEQGILDKASEEAQRTLYAFLTLLPIAGVETVQIITQEPNLAQLIYPSSCLP